MLYRNLVKSAEDNPKFDIHAYIYEYISSLWYACQCPNDCLAGPSASSCRVAPLTFPWLLDSRSRAGCCWRTEPAIPPARGRWWSSSSPRIYCSAFVDIAAVGNRTVPLIAKFSLFLSCSFLWTSWNTRLHYHIRFGWKYTRRIDLEFQH